jgi:ABC-type sulfate/molybdate transport systems ATPase subunit
MKHIVFPAVEARYASFAISVPSLTLAEGEILGIFGKSGAGKTTYLHRIRQHFPPERVVYMSQFDALLEESTVRQNIELGIACTAKPALDAEAWENTYAPLLNEFEVDRHLGKYPRMMSGGQRKRAEIVRALIMDPEILLLDEPFQGIGHIFETVSTKHITNRARRRSGVTVIVSHDFELLCRFCSRVLLVDDQGVIGMVPTDDPSWRPRNLREAWTLGVENLIPKNVATTLLQNVPLRTSMHEGAFLAFWRKHALWIEKPSTEKEPLLRMSVSQMLHARSHAAHGTLSTELECKAADGTPFSLAGIGRPAPGEDALLSIKEYWIIDM